MTKHILGLHHLAYHQDGADWQHIEAMQYRSAKVFDWMWNNPAYVGNLVAAMPNDAIFLARDYPLSEQRDWQTDPLGTANRHADDWANKVATGKCLLPPARTYFLGANEPEVWAYRHQAVEYYAAFCRRLKQHGLRAGALNLSVGWPGTKDGTSEGLPDWMPYELVHQAIVESGSILVLNEYGAHDNHGFGYWLMRLQHCPWQDVQIVIGECGIDDAVNPGGRHSGWQVFMGAVAYCDWLDEYHAKLTADPRIHSAMPFTYDFSAPWGSFDVRPARGEMERYNWTVSVTTTPSQPPPPVVVKPANVPPLTHPIADPTLRIITQRFGEHPEDYAQFGLAGHNGADFATPIGTPVRAVDGGTVVEAQELSGYGKYVKIRHAWGESVYAHLDRRAVEAGAVVAAGFVIGLSGNSGNSTGAHLHFGIRVNPYKRGAPYDGYSDPLPYLEAAAPAPGHPDSALWNLIQEVAKEMLIPAPLLASLAWAESSFRPDVTSPAGAQGIMQIMPTTFEEWAPQVGATDPLNAKDNLRVGAAYLAWLLNKLGNEWAALHAYSWGIGNVLALREPPGDVVNYTNKVIHGADLLTAVLKEGNK